MIADLDRMMSADRMIASGQISGYYGPIHGRNRLFLGSFV